MASAENIIMTGVRDWLSTTLSVNLNLVQQQALEKVATGLLVDIGGADNPYDPYVPPSIFFIKRLRDNKLGSVSGLSTTPLAGTAVLVKYDDGSVGVEQPSDIGPR